MEKAMYQTHGFGYEEYKRNLENRMQVERDRDKNYKQSMQLISELERNVYNRIGL
jgi:biopolymer transport protein ExbD